MLRGDVEKDDSVVLVFTEQGSSVSQMTAAKVMNVIARLLDCEGQAADAASSCTQVKMEAAPQLLKIPKSECPDVWIRHPRHDWRKSRSNMIDPVVLFERNLHGHPLAGELWGRQFEEVLLELGWEKYRIRNVCLFIGNKDCFVSVYVEDIKNGWKEAGYGSHVEEIDAKTLILTNQLHFLIPYIGDAVNVKRCHCRIQRNVRITNFCWSN